MATTTKPWELPLEDDRLPFDDETKETDPLLPGKISDGFDFTFGLKGFIEELNVQFGYKLLVLLCATQFLLKGFTIDFVRKGEPYLYKLYHVPADTAQIYNGVTQLPWATKPIIGLISDVLPINGYNKAPYILLWSTLSVVAFACIGLLPTAVLPVSGLVIAIVVIQMQASTSDLLSEAKYAEKMRERPAHGPALLTYVWFGMYAGGLAAVLLSGVIIARHGPHAIYVIGIFPAAFVLLPVALNYLEENKLSQDRIEKIRSHFWSQAEACILCCVMLGVCLALIFLGLTEGPVITSVAAVLLGIVVLASFSLFLSPTIAKFNAFSIIQSSMSLSVGGASFYFFTDTPEQFPEGPHFSPFFYNSVLGAVGSLCALFGVFCYQRYMSTWKYRHILVLTNALYCLVCLPDVILFSRLNVKLGIPDHYFMLGASVLQNVVSQWQWMPQVVILSFLCPKGMEATMYALLAGSHNLGNTIAANCGAALLRSMGITPNGSVGESHKFDHLWIASSIATMLPLITIIALFWLIPDARQNETIIDADEDATSGSLWRRWTRKDGQ